MIPFLEPMDCFNVHTHKPLHPGNEIVSYDVSDLPTHKEGYISIGIHPWFLTKDNAETHLKALQKAILMYRPIAIGEAGLDKLKGPSMEFQTEIFKKVAALAEEHSLPLVIHCVKAFNELIRIKQEIRPRQTWIIHGFRGKAPLANELIRHGFRLSLGASFQPGMDGESVKNHLFIESDESETTIEDIYQSVANTLHIPLEELVEAVKMNVKKVFFKA